MSRNQTSSWNRISQEQDKIFSLPSTRLELVPDRVITSELNETAEFYPCEGELSYRSLYEESPSIHFALDPKGMILSVNRFGANSLGYAKDELVDKPIFQLFATSERERLSSVILSLFKISSPGEVVNSEFRLNCLNSEVIWVKVTVRILPGEEKNPVVLMVCEDITAHKRLEVAYLESEQQFQIIANNAPVMLWMANSNGLYHFFNKFWLDFTGRTIEQVQGIGWLENVHVDDKIECLQTYYSALNTRKKFHMEYRLQRANGEYRWISDTGIPKFTPSGEFAGYIGCCVDITEGKLVEVGVLQSETEKETQLEMEKLNRLKDEFLSTVSHELRTPLTNMKMAIQMLGIALKIGQVQEVTQQIHPKTARYFQILNNECEREINLINNFLDLQKLDINNKPLVLEAVFVQEWLVKVVELFKARNRYCLCHLYVDIDPNLPQLVTDPFSLERILIELLTNACKFSPVGEEVIVSASFKSQKLKSQFIEIRVTNTGVEIPKSELPLIFDKFYRIPSNDPWKRGGTGLGLALVQKLTKYLQGTIEVESGSNCTCFSLKLPVCRD
ncbi:MAG: PAS domain-containing sensor histidine kinase [Calothrix sp. C42_A2020_038]|nr:PAS domain-containing sensor histidine kinase [Calothrix sp. C42_A2020_038]